MSNSFNAIGLKTLKEQKLHHQTYVLKKGQQLSDNIKERMEHGTKNKVSLPSVHNLSILDFLYAHE